MKLDKCLMECRYESNNRELNLRDLMLVPLSIPERFHANLTTVFAGSDSGVYLTFRDKFRMAEFDNWIRQRNASVGQYLKSDQKVTFIYQSEFQPPEVEFPNGDRHDLHTLWCEQ